MTVSVKPKPGPIKPIIKPASVVPKLPPKPIATAQPTTSKQVADVIKKHSQPVQSIAPEDDPSQGMEEVVQQAEESFQEPVAAPAPTKIGKPVKVVTSTKHKDGTETVSEEVKGEAIVAERHATVGYSTAITKNLGNYESVKVAVSIFIPCDVDAEEIEATYEQAKEWVDEKVSAVNDEISSQIEQ